MKHLIIGYGNIGKRHHETLKRVGETSIEVWDRKFGSDIPDLSGYDCVYICVPPQDHEYYLKIFGSFLLYSKTNIFCEKPLVHTFLPLDFVPPQRLFVACNYRFCRDYWWGDIKFVEYGYCYKTPYSYLDLVHMVDLCWEKYGKPIRGNLFTKENKHLLSMEFENGRFISVHADNESPIKYGRLNGIDVVTASMFEDHMKHFLEFASGRTENINPFQKAYERTCWLINLKTF